MIGRLRERIFGSREGRLVFIAAVIEVAAIASSYFIVRALADGVWDATPGRAYLLGYLMWTVPVSAWIGIRGSGIYVDGSFFAYFGPAMFIAAATGLSVLGVGIVVDIFDCRTFGDGAPGSPPHTDCYRVFPSFTSLLAFLMAVAAMLSITFYSIVIGYAASKVRGVSG